MKNTPSLGPYAVAHGDQYVKPFQPTPASAHAAALGDEFGAPESDQEARDLAREFTSALRVRRERPDDASAEHEALLAEGKLHGALRRRHHARQAGATLARDWIDSPADAGSAAPRRAGMSDDDARTAAEGFTLGRRYADAELRRQGH